MLPQFGDKSGLISLVNPETFVEYAREQGKFPKTNGPELAIVNFHNKITDRLRFSFDNISAPRPFEESWILSPNASSPKFLSGRLGIGAPLYAASMEEWVVWGVKRFVLVGLCGGLQADLQAGDIILGDYALRDEGISHHYLSPGRFAYGNKNLADRVAEILLRNDHAFRRGGIWTTDAPYRETKEELLAYRAEGLLGVDMETAAMMAVGAHRGVEVTSVLIVSDILHEQEWQPHFTSSRLWEVACDVAQALATEL
jgi:uridine phosphorylase